jgi:hypothetical protein
LATGAGRSQRALASAERKTASVGARFFIQASQLHYCEENSDPAQAWLV